MSFRIYMVNFAVQSANLFDFENFLKTDYRVWAYWNYIPLTYGLKTPLSSGELTTALLPFFPGGNFIVSEINHLNVDGRLPLTAWEWFYQEAKPRNALTSSFSSLFGDGRT